MSRPFDLAEVSYENASLAHREVPSIPVTEMPTSALFAELCSYLTPNEERERAILMGWGLSKELRAAIRERQDAVCAEIDRRIPRS